MSLDLDGNEVLPTFNVAEIARWRCKLGELFMPDHLGDLLAGDLLIDLTQTIARMLVKGKELKQVFGLSEDDGHVYRAVYDTLLAHGGGKTIEYPLAETLARVVAGNVHLLRAGWAVPVWQCQTAPAWALVKIVDVYPTTTPRRQIHGHMLVMEILTGSAVSRNIHQFVTDGMLNRMARRLGIRTARDRRPVHPREMTMLYTSVKLRAGDRLEITEYMERPGLNTRNKARGVQRDKYKELCPIQSQWPCTFCYRGFDCQLGTHAREYVRGKCYNGHEGWVDPRSSGLSLCLACQQHRWAAKHGGSYTDERDRGIGSSSTPA